MNTLLFSERHIGISPEAEQKMLAKIGLNSLEELIDKTLPRDIRLTQEPEPIEPMSEARFAEHIAGLAAQNKLFRSYIGQGWYGSITPAVIQRNVFENPGWYTSYTPYQAEISQGRLEALLHFQTLVCELSGLPLSNSSLLDEATSAAEAAYMMFNLRSREQEKSGANKLFVDRGLFAPSLAVLKTRCSEQGIELVLGDYAAFRPDESFFGALLQYPNAEGKVENYRSFADKVHKAGLKLAVAADLMALVMLEAPGKWGADIVFGSSQRFGIPMGYGGPAAAYFAAREEFKRQMPGRIVGLSRDSRGKTAYRLALQTREQHIKREKATSNICTATALMAIMSAFYAIYHGPKGLRDIATRIHGMTSYLNDALEVYGYEQENSSFFDTLKIKLPEGLSSKSLRKLAEAAGINLYYYPDGKTLGLSLDETVDNQALNDLIEIFASAAGNLAVPVEEENWNSICALDDSLLRQEPVLQQSVFNSYHSETAMMRFIKTTGTQGYFAGTLHDSVGLLHHEAQCRFGNVAAEPAGIRRNPSHGTQRTSSRLPQHHRQTEATTLRLNRFCGLFSATQFRGRRRIYRTEGDQGISQSQGSSRQKYHPYPRFGSRNQSRQCRSGRLFHSSG